MRKLLLLLLISGIYSINYAQNTWIQKANVGSIGRENAVAFSIGNKGYIGTGFTGAGTKDFWEYDPSTDTWTQKSDLPGASRMAATGFSLGNFGYLGTGISGSTRLKDFWQYDPSTNLWSQKADFGGVGRSSATGFAIDNKAYIGLGYDGTTAVTDFWEYNPSTNTWTQKANFGGGQRGAVASFSIGNKGYVGTGWDGTIRSKEFWEYDPQLNLWTRKADFGGTARRSATGFAIGIKGYIGTGDDGTSTKDFWEYDPLMDIWTKMADFGGVGRYLAIGFSIGNTGYIGTGLGGVRRNDIWAYLPPLPLDIEIDSISNTIFCAGDSVTIYFNASPNFSSTNTFLVMLSDTVGNFGSSTVIGNLNSEGGNLSISNTIPVVTPSQQYKIRIIASSPASVSDTIENIIIRKPEVSLDPNSKHELCQGSSVVLSTIGNANYTYSWYRNNNILSSFQHSHITGDTGWFKVKVTDQHGCVDVDSVQITPDTTMVSISPPDPLIQICENDSVLLEAVSNTNNTYQWYESNIPLPGRTNPAWYVKEEGIYEVAATNTHTGCTVLASVHITVSKIPSDIFLIGANEICQGDSLLVVVAYDPSYQYAWHRNGVQIPGANNYSIYAKESGAYKAKIFTNNCEKFTEEGHLTVNPLPQAFVVASGDTSFCQGDSVQLSANFNSQYNYRWFRNSNLITGESGVSLITKNTGTYRAEVSTSKGCKKFSNGLNVTAFSLPPKPVITHSGNFLISSSASGNQWYLDGVIIPGATTDKVAALNDGSYSVQVTDSNECSMFSDPFLITSAEKSSLNTFKVHPNPVLDKIHIENIKAESLRILTIEGKTVYTTNNFRTGDIDVSFLDRGIYFLQINTLNGVINRKFIKQ